MYGRLLLVEFLSLRNLIGFDRVLFILLFRRTNRGAKFELEIDRLRKESTGKPMTINLVSARALFLY